MSDASRPYRLLRLHPISGEIRSNRELTAFSDDQAIGYAIDEAGDDRVELWRGDRRLAAISGGDGPTELSIASPED